MIGLEHLANCHGEWAALLALIGMIPLFGPWIRTKIAERRTCHHEDACHRDELGEVLDHVPHVCHEDQDPPGDEGVGSVVSTPHLHRLP